MQACFPHKQALGRRRVHLPMYRPHQQWTPAATLLPSIVLSEKRNLSWPDGEPVVWARYNGEAFGALFLSALAFTGPG